MKTCVSPTSCSHCGAASSGCCFVPCKPFRPFLSVIISLFRTSSHVAVTLLCLELFYSVLSTLAKVMWVPHSSIYYYTVSVHPKTQLVVSAVLLSSSLDFPCMTKERTLFPPLTPFQNLFRLFNFFFFSSHLLNPHTVWVLKYGTHRQREGE